jgi:hypothetical protein
VSIIILTVLALVPAFGVLLMVQIFERHYRMMVLFMPPE